MDTTITVENYTDHVLRTCLPENQSFLHAVLGISSEVGEVIETIAYHKANLDEEKGDLSWYSALAAYVVGLKFPDLVYKSLEQPCHTDAAHKDLLVMLQGDLADVLKRNLFYGLPMDLPKIEATLIKILFFIHRGNLHDFLRVVNYNIMKLRVRYPEKFDTDSAENRNLEAEAQVFVK